jgi:AraC family transcriptional regulator
MNSADLKNINKLVGDISADQLKHTQCFLTRPVQLFMPMTGPCYYAVQAHAHPAFSFVYTFDNHSKIKIDGRTVTPAHGRILAMSPGLVHMEITSQDQFARYVAIFIDTDTFNHEFSHYGDPKKQNYQGDCFAPSPQLLPSLKEFMAEHEAKAAGHEQMLSVLGIQIIHHIIRSILGMSGRVPRKIKHRIEVDKAIEFMHENFWKKISVGEIASHVAMSTSHFARIFKKEIRQSPFDYLIGIRLERAKRLLMAGEKNITDIALSTGFKSSSHFCTAFLQKYKQPPSFFKKSLGNPEQEQDMAK